MNKTENFIENARLVHGDKYDYSKVEYKNNRTKVCIICPKHGEFWQTPWHHLSGHGCKKCASENLWKEKRKKTSFEDFKEKIEKKFGNIYDFSKANFIDMHSKITVGYGNKFFQTTPSKLLSNKTPIKHNFVENKEDFIVAANLLYNNKYDYSKVNYVNSHNKVCIICPKHGEFWQTPNEHLTGHQCQKCVSSKLQDELRRNLIENRISFIEEYSPSYLNNKYSHQRFDFYIPELSLAIECQGRQHFIPFKLFGGQEEFEKGLKRDINKYSISCSKNVKVLYLIDRHFSIGEIINDEKFNGIYTKENTFKTIKKLIFEIKKQYE